MINLHFYSLNKTTNNLAVQENMAANILRSHHQFPKVSTNRITRPRIDQMPDETPRSSSSSPDAWSSRCSDLYYKSYRHFPEVGTSQVTRPSTKNRPSKAYRSPSSSSNDAWSSHCSGRYYHWRGAFFSSVPPMTPLRLVARPDVPPPATPAPQAIKLKRKKESLTEIKQNVHCPKETKKNNANKTNDANIPNKKEEDGISKRVENIRVSKSENVSKDRCGDAASDSDKTVKTENILKSAFPSTVPRRSRHRPRTPRRDANSKVVIDDPCEEWAGGLRALRDSHVRLVVRQLRHIATLNQALDRVPSLPGKMPCRQKIPTPVKKTRFDFRK